MTVSIIGGKRFMYKSDFKSSRLRLMIGYYTIACLRNL